jgi:regulator of RNase E activity RraA
MKKKLVFVSKFILVFLIVSGTATPLLSQYGVFGKEDLVKYTRQWEGERFPDGRPKVSDEILEKLRGVVLEDLMGPLYKAGYKNQIDTEGWLVMHPQRPVIGRAVTASFMPYRPDINEIINEDGLKDGMERGQNSWPIDRLVKGDVIVVDLFGKIDGGTYAGDNLATTIAKRVGPGGGMIIDGSVRDADGIYSIENFNTIVRDYHHSGISDVMLMSYNAPIRIGKITCMPGDIVVSSMEGIAVIPVHLVEEVVDRVERTQLRNTFGKLRIKEGVYTAGQVDSRWTEEMEKDYNNWLNEYREKNK